MNEQLQLLDFSERRIETAPTEQEIMDARTPAGSWTRKTLARWGVAWPPRAGWKAELIARSKQADRKDRPIKIKRPLA